MGADGQPGQPGKRISREWTGSQPSQARGQARNGSRQPGKSISREWKQTGGGQPSKRISKEQKQTGSKASKAKG